jgi:ABC-type hemin transport system ATPase subunit
MIQAVQCIGWSLLSPEPMFFEAGVIAMLGKNGSGKSSSLDSVKALLGARRFGQGRSIGSYRFAGRAGAPAARAAYVIGVLDNRRPDGGRRLEQVGADELTVVLEASSSQRRFLVRPGRHLLDPDGDLGTQIQALRSDHPRAQWLRPSDYERRYLLPLGFGPAVRRLLELPQGEVQRALDRDPHALVGLLVELTGGRDAAESFARAQTAVTEARQAHAEARRRVDRRRATLAETRLRAEAQRRDIGLRHRLGGLAAQIDRALERSEREHRRARSAVEPTPEPRPQTTAPATQEPQLAPRRSPRLNPTNLETAGLSLTLFEGVWCVAPEDRDRAAELLGPGESLPVAAESLRFLLHSGALVRGPMLEHRASLLPRQPEPEPPESTAPTISSEQQRMLRQLRGAAEALQSAGIAAEVDSEESLPDEPAALLGAYRALTAEGIPAAVREPDHDKLAEQQALLGAEQDELTRRETALEEAASKLNQARTAYEQAVERSLRGAAGRFAALCADAGLAGEMTVVDSPQGPQVHIAAAEAANEPMRSLWGAQASLSGGWRTTVVVLALLACLDGATALPVLPLDEVGSSLDETRLSALGQAFARLSERRGLQTIMSLPTGAMSEVVATFASMQIGFFRPLAGEPLAPPPHIVSLRGDPPAAQAA